jgi:glycosyltransferase involved in cell wall biosynthesis
LGLLYQYFPFSERNILRTVHSFRPHIINVHNTQGAYFPVPLIQKISAYAPVVWTLHDMWSFTGNASHTFGNMSWKYLRNDRHLTKIPPKIGINTGAWLLKRKKKIYQHARLTIVTPSLWLKKLAEQSPVFEGKAIHHIFNGIDSKQYYPGNKEAARLKLGLPQNNPTIMFSSHFLDKNNPWKGGADLLKILSKINAGTSKKINLLMLGEGGMTELSAFSNFNVYNKGYVREESLIRDCFIASDLFIYPTRADNLPNVLVESIACGTPCITFDIGGNTEIIKHNINGVIIQPFDFDSFARETLLLLNDRPKLSEFSANCIDVVKTSFLLQDMTDKYFQLFNTL